MIGPKGTDLYELIVAKDLYRINGRDPNDFDFIFDIGANIGWFSLKAKMKFINAKVVAVEADDKLVSYLKQNLNMLYNVAVTHAALGNDGAYFGIREIGAHPLNAMVVPEEWPSAKKVNTVTLKQLFDTYGCDTTKKYMLKINCEGGEYSLKGVQEAEDILKNAEQVSMMLHFQSKETPFKHWPTYEEAVTWFVTLFKKTHTIEYVYNGIRRGDIVVSAKKERVFKDIGSRKLAYIQTPNLLYHERFFHKRVKMDRAGVNLGMALVKTLGLSSVVDFGCGIGSYLKGAKKVGAEILGFDILFDRAKKYIKPYYFPFIRYGNVGRHIDCGKWDCALSVETAEHLLPEEADVFCDNLVDAATKFIVITTSEKPAYYHLNPQPKRYWIEKLEKRGVKYSEDHTKLLTTVWQRNGAPGYILRNLMVFVV